MEAPALKPKVVRLNRAIMELRIRQLFDARMRGDPDACGSGRTVDIDIWNFVTFRGDKFIELIEAYDTPKVRELET